jgi:YidC/Oxa1 family membrane protein insertase
MTFVLANIFQPLIDVFDSVIRFFHDQVGFSWGLSIIALTVLVRSLLLPLTLRQFKSMQKLQEFAPQMKELQERYKDDKPRLNEEMMKFYRENKVNPFGSCLPIVAQLPVFVSLFYMLRKDLKVDICGPLERIQAYGAEHGTTLANTYCDKIDPGSAKWFFIPDLTAPATGAVLATLLVLYVGSQLFSSVLMSVTTDRNQRMLLIGMPFFFVVFVFRFPAGLLLYWITTNIWTVGQQLLVRRAAGAPMPWKARAEEREKKAVAAAGKTAQRAVVATTPPPPPRRKKKRSGRRR